MFARKLSILLAVLFVTALITSCSKSDEQQQREEAQKQAETMAESLEKMGEELEKAENPEDFAEAMSKLGEALGGGEKVEPVHFRELMALLPQEIDGMQASKPTGERASTFGVKVSHAEVKFHGKNGEQITVKITDLGTLKGIAAMSRYAWTMGEFDRETESGYERTISYKGYKGFERYDEPDRQGELDFIVGNRFIVEIDGYDVDMKGLEAVRDQIPFERLERLSESGEE